MSLTPSHGFWIALSRKPSPQRPSRRHQRRVCSRASLSIVALWRRPAVRLNTLAQAERCA